MHKKNIPPEWNELKTAIKQEGCLASLLRLTPVTTVRSMTRDPEYDSCTSSTAGFLAHASTRCHLPSRDIPVAKTLQQQHSAYTVTSSHRHHTCFPFNLCSLTEAGAAAAPYNYLYQFRKHCNTSNHGFQYNLFIPGRMRNQNSSNSHCRLAENTESVAMTIRSDR